jgi:hypothetical protein
MQNFTCNSFLTRATHDSAFHISYALPPNNDHHGIFSVSYDNLHNHVLYILRYYYVMQATGPCHQPATEGRISCSRRLMFYGHVTHISGPHAGHYEDPHNNG